MDGALETERQIGPGGSGRIENEDGEADPLIIGAIAAPGSSGNFFSFFNGVVDEFLIFNRALSSNEIAAIYAARSAGMCPPGSAPQIVVQPQSRNVIAGSATALTVIATGFSPLTYQWSFNGVSVPGATNATFSILNAQATDAGDYSVVVSNPAGSVSSSPATINVILVPPLISLLSPTNQETFFPATNGIRFAVTSAQSGMTPHVALQLNGSDASSGLSLSGPPTNLQGAYLLLQSNRFYTATLTASNASGQTEQTFQFDTRLLSDPGSPTNCLNVVLITPTNNATFHAYETGLVFQVQSCRAIAPSSVSLILNNEDVSTNLLFSGNPTNWLVSYTNLEPYKVYDATVTVDANATTAPGQLTAAFVNPPPRISLPLHFDTRPPERPEACETSVEVEAFTEIYFSTTDALKTILPQPFSKLLKVPSNLTFPVRLGEAVQNRCGEFSFLFMKLKLDFNEDAERTLEFNTDTSLAGFRKTVKGVREIPVKVLVNKDKSALLPDLAPCHEKPLERIAHVGGNVSAYAFIVGNGSLGGYPRKVSRGKFRLCRELVVENNSSSVIEIPIKVSGDIFVAGSFSISPKVHGIAKLSLNGSIAGQAVSESISITNKNPDPFGDEKSINVTRRITVAPGSGTFRVPITLSAEALVDIQAHASGLNGSIANSVTASVNFPNSIDIGDFTGPNGSPLPPGVKIYDAESGEIHAYTGAAPVISTQPESQDLIANSSGELFVNVLGAGPLSYQWHQNGQPIAGATNASLTFPSAQVSDAGIYSVLVSNSAGSVTSEAATLRVGLPPLVVSFVPESGTLSFSWPSGGNQVLEGAVSLTAPVAWTEVPVTPTTANGQTTATVGLNSPFHYFRLRSNN